MDAIVRCPNCEAELTLQASLKRQAVKCPRCKHEFKLSQPRSSSAITTELPHDVKSRTATEDRELYEQPKLLIPLEPLRGEWLAMLTRLLLAVAIAGLLIFAYALSDFNDLPRRFLFRLLDGSLFWTSLTVLLALFAFLVWSYFAAANARLLQATGILPWQALLLGLMFPGVNFIVAYINFQDLWRASDPDEIEAPDSWKTVNANWWIRFCGLNFLCAAILIFAGLISRSEFLFLIADLNLLAASVLLSVMIRQITIRQRQRYRRLYEDPA